MFETRVFVRNNCLIRPKPAPEAAPEFFGALAAIFLPILVEKAIGTVASAFKKLGEDETLRASGRLPTYLYRLVKSDAGSGIQLNPDFKSVIVVRGSFDKKTGEQPEIDRSDAVTKLRAGGIMVRELALVYEAQVEIADDGTALRYESRYFELSRFIHDGREKSKSNEHRAVVLNLTISGVGEKEGEPVLSMAMINFGELKGGAILEPDDLTSKQSSWLGGLAISEASLKAIENMDPAGPSVNVMPVTIEATIAETKDGNAALKFIGEILDSTKETVSKTVSSEILDRGTRAGEAASAFEKLLGEEETAFAALLEAESEFAKLPEPSTPPTAAEMKAMAVKRFAIEAAGRAWCVKFGALQQLGRAPSRPGHTCPVVLP
jgi:hypothetical protein